jgi:PPOX class probable F420-dependent enzyme
MARRPTELTDADLAFLAERHLGTLTTLRADGTPHVVAIAFTYVASEGVVRIITRHGSQKVRNVERAGRAVVSQVDGRRWLTLEGPAVVVRQPEEVARAVAAFESRYRPTEPNPERVGIEIMVDRVLGRG